jgi:hypothetical protein
MNLGEKKDRAIRPDAQAFDEVRIVTNPRYKMSGLSGDEWRISATVQFWRKGILRHEVGHRNIETACGMLYGDLSRAQDDGKAYFAGEDNFCDQEGCLREATVVYRKKYDYCREAHKTELKQIVLRYFCDIHKKRGDAAFDDADDNYEIVVP